MRVLALLALLAATPTLADDSEWTTADTYRQVAFTAFAVMDVATTHYALKQPDRTQYTETNPFLGTNPSHTKLNLLAGAAILGHATISYLLPNPYRKYWQYVGIIAEVDSVAVNSYVMGGVKMRWEF